MKLESRDEFSIPILGVVSCQRNFQCLSILRGLLTLRVTRNGNLALDTVLPIVDTF
jgi:hypothetical protein